MDPKLVLCWRITRRGGREVQDRKVGDQAGGQEREGQEKIERREDASCQEGEEEGRARAVEVSFDRPFLPFEKAHKSFFFSFSASKKKPSWTYEVVLPSEDHSTPSHRPTRAPTVPWTEEECEVSPSIQPVEKKRSP